MLKWIRYQKPQGNYLDLEVHSSPRLLYLTVTPYCEGELSSWRHLASSTFCKWYFYLSLFYQGNWQNQPYPSVIAIFQSFISRSRDMQVPANVLWFIIRKLLAIVFAYWKRRSKVEERQTFYLFSQLRISDASTICPTWVLSWLSLRILNLPLPTCCICARNTWLECWTTHHVSISWGCCCFFLLNKILSPGTLKIS
jgi:hypothetical protein